MTLVVLIRSLLNWYSIVLTPLCIWDGYLHIVLPVSLMVGFPFLLIKDRLKKDSQMSNEFEDLKVILGSLTQGVAITADLS